MIVGTVLYPFKNSPGLYLNIASLMLIILALLITVLVEVPIDSQIKKWEITTLPENWQNLRAKWQFYHTLRTFVCMGSFLLLLAGTLFYR
jgi:uncharacterized membrane protein